MMSGKVGKVGMSDIHIRVCRRDILCADCDDKTCWNAGRLIANCPLWICNRTGEQFENCETCELMHDIREEHRRKKQDGQK